VKWLSLLLVVPILLLTNKLPWEENLIIVGIVKFILAITLGTVMFYILSNY